MLAALVVAFVSVLARPRSVGSDKPLEILLAYSHLASFAYACAPFLHPRKSKSARKTELSENEELEEIHLEQGRAAINRVLETNRFDPEVSEMLHNVLALSDSLTREIMVPRTDMICIEKDDTLEDFLKLCSRSGYSRIPVIGNDIDDLLGIAYMKDAVRATIFNNAALSRPIESIMRKPMLVPELKPADDLFHEMQQTCHHVAVVVDEYGGIAGMVTIEDALEQIVGELQDEHDHTQHGEPRQILSLIHISMCIRDSNHLAIPGIHQIAQREIDESVYATKWDGGLRAIPGQRHETCSFAACEDDGKNLGVLLRHSSSFLRIHRT